MEQFSAIFQRPSVKIGRWRQGILLDGGAHLFNYCYFNRHDSAARIFVGLIFVTVVTYTRHVLFILQFFFSNNI